MIFNHRSVEIIMSAIEKLPNVTFKTRVHDESVPGPNPYRWEDKCTDDLFAGKRVVVFSLPGAFTPTCSSNHLPRYEALFEEFKAQGVDSIICVSVNDAFVMFQWGKSQNAKNVFLLPDGNGDFTRKMGMLVDKADLELGTVSATKLSGYQLRITVTVRPRGDTQMMVRANAQYMQTAVEDPKPYQDFFTALEKSMFLTAYQVD